MNFPHIAPFSHGLANDFGKPHFPHENYYYNHILILFVILVSSAIPKRQSLKPIKKMSPIYDVLKGRKRVPAPIWLMRQAGRYLPEYRKLRAEAKSFLDLCYDPILVTEITLQPVKRFGLDAAILFSDILVIPDALGLAVDFKEDKGPVVEQVSSIMDLRRVKPEQIRDRLSPVYEAVDRISQAVPVNVAKIGFAGAPWTVVTYMLEGGSSRDFAVAKHWLYTRPDEFAELIEILVDATTIHLLAQIEAGVDVVQVFDSWAGVLAEEEFRRWCIAPMAEIVRRLKQSAPQVPIIGFPRLAGALYRDYVAETGVDGISLDTSVSRGWAAETLQPYCALQGNLDPAVLVAGGTAMVVRVGEILRAWGGGRFIFNLGHGVLPQTPPEHVAKLVEIVRQQQNIAA